MRKKNEIHCTGTKLTGTTYMYMYVAHGFNVKSWRCTPTCRGRLGLYVEPPALLWTIICFASRGGGSERSNKIEPDVQTNAHNKLFRSYVWNSFFFFFFFFFFLEDQKRQRLVCGNYWKNHDPARITQKLSSDHTPILELDWPIDQALIAHYQYVELRSWSLVERDAKRRADLSRSKDFLWQVQSEHQVWSSSSAALALTWPRGLEGALFIALALARKRPPKHPARPALWKSLSPPLLATLLARQVWLHEVDVNALRERELCALLGNSAAAPALVGAEVL